MFVLRPVLAQIFGWALALPLWLGVHLVLTALVDPDRASRRPSLSRCSGTRRESRRCSRWRSIRRRGRASSETLTAKALGDADPLAAAAVLLDREELARMARERLLDPDLDPARRDEIETLLEQEEVPMETVLAPPSRQSDSDRFCPRCRAQYRAGVERCADCEDVALVSVPLTRLRAGC
jgi:hypothetical protein